jgi:hypothetical protein
MDLTIVKEIVCGLDLTSPGYGIMAGLRDDEHKHVYLFLHLFTVVYLITLNRSYVVASNDRTIKETYEYERDTS